jgi:hypothetical protein
LISSSASIMTSTCFLSCSSVIMVFKTRRSQSLPASSHPCCLTGCALLPPSTLCQPRGIPSLNMRVTHHDECSRQWSVPRDTRRTALGKSRR